MGVDDEVYCEHGGLKRHCARHDRFPDEAKPSPYDDKEYRDAATREEDLKCPHVLNGYKKDCIVCTPETPSLSKEDQVIALLTENNLLLNKIFDCVNDIWMNV